MAQIMTECGRGHNILSIDVHPDPDKPWILASHANGNVSIWNYQTRARESEFRVSHVTGTDVWGLTHWISCAKFIPGEECIVAGGGNGDIHVVMYTTEQEVKRFNAHKSSVESLAVHPNRPLVLSACMGKLIKLWNRNVEEDADWEWIRTFKGHDDYLKHVTFSPDGNTFASASQDCTVKIWNIEDRDPIATLDCGEDIQQHVAYFSTGDGRNYIIAGSLKGSARVWDWRANTCIQLDEGPYSEVYGCNVGVINFAPDHNSPVLITVSEDMSISLRDAATHKPRFDEFNDLDLNHGPPQDFVYIKSTRSLAIACSRGIAILDMTEAMNEDLIRRVTGRPKRVIRKPHWLLSADWDTSQD